MHPHNIHMQAAADAKGKFFFIYTPPVLVGRTALSNNYTDYPQREWMLPVCGRCFSREDGTAENGFFQ